MISDIQWIVVVIKAKAVSSISEEEAHLAQSLSVGRTLTNPSSNSNSGMALVWL